MIVPSVQLNNGILMPQFGLGVYKAKDGDEVEEAIATALASGYRLIDTAAIYRNEEGVGRAIAASAIPREEIFVTTKLWNDDQGYEQTHAAFNKSLERLGLDYVDLYLIHWPIMAENKSIETWRALEEIYADGKSRAIGLSNFMPKHIDALLAQSEVVPAVNQIELHPRLTQEETIIYCREKGIAVESWSPLMRAGELFEHEIIKDLAGKYEREPAQVILRWHIQLGLIAIPKSVTPERIRSNIRIFDFELDEDEMSRISSLNENYHLGPDPNKMWLVHEP
jgi:methylglyoxal/glyoxal reductase